MDDQDLPPGTEQGEECPWYDPFCWGVEPPVDIPAEVPPIPGVPPGTIPGTPPGPGGLTEIMCPVGWVCQTAEVHQQQIDDAKTAKYVWAAGVGVAALVGGIALGGMLKKG